MQPVAGLLRLVAFSWCFSCSALQICGPCCSWRGFLRLISSPENYNSPAHSALHLFRTTAHTRWCSWWWGPLRLIRSPHSYKPVSHAAVAILVTRHCAHAVCFVGGAAAGGGNPVPKPQPRGHSADSVLITSFAPLLTTAFCCAVCGAAGSGTPFAQSDHTASGERCTTQRPVPAGPRALRLQESPCVPG